MALRNIGPILGVATAEMHLVLAILAPSRLQILTAVAVRLVVIPTPLQALVVAAFPILVAALVAVQVLVGMAL